VSRGARPRRRAVTTLLALGLVGSAGVPAAAAPATQAVSVGLGVETLHLPGQERLGLVGGSLLFDLGQGLWAGPVTYGAATGQRGGFFVGGVELQRRWALGDGLTLAAGLSLGGGGGAAAPVGNGLMLRPAAALLQDIGPLQAGLTLSSVRFPGTHLRSQQAGLLLAWHGRFDHWPLARLGERVAADQRSGLGFDSVAVTTAQHHAVHVATGPQRFQLVGARLAQRRDAQGSDWGLEAAAAAQGSAAGYMEILLHASQAWAVTEGLSLGLRGAVGLGGGGGVPTGGGALQRLDGTLSLVLRPGWRVGAAWGRTFGATPSLHAQRAELWLAADLEPAALPGTPGRTGTVRRHTWGGALLHIAPTLRGDGSRRAVDALGLVLERAVGEHAYLTGQTYSAFGGGAGGYSIGLIGGGWASRATPAGWLAGAELLAGGAGGGGVRGSSGALLMAQAWAGRHLGSADQQLRLGLAALASSAGGPVRPAATLSWTAAFGQPGP